MASILTPEDEQGLVDKGEAAPRQGRGSREKIIAVVLAVSLTINLVACWPRRSQEAKAAGQRSVPEGRPASLEDRLFCASQDEVPSAFCQQDLPGARARILREFLVAHGQCAFQHRKGSIPFRQLSGLKGRYTLDMPAWAVTSPHKTMGASAYEHLAGPLPRELDDVWISVTDDLDTDLHVTVEHCAVVDDARASVVDDASAPGADMRGGGGDGGGGNGGGDDGSGGGQTHWTIERIGPLTGAGGYQWISAGWPDAGGFSGELQRGDVFVTAFGFMPVGASDGAILGSPPIHIHHMHVTSSQSWSFTGHGDVHVHVHVHVTCACACACASYMRMFVWQ